MPAGTLALPAEPGQSAATIGTSAGGNTTMDPTFLSAKRQAALIRKGTIGARELLDP